MLYAPFNWLFGPWGLCSMDLGRRLSRQRPYHGAVSRAFWVCDHDRKGKVPGSGSDPPTPAFARPLLVPLPPFLPSLPPLPLPLLPLAALALEGEVGLEGVEGSGLSTLPSSIAWKTFLALLWPYSVPSINGTGVLVSLSLRRHVPHRRQWSVVPFLKPVI